MTRINFRAPKLEALLRFLVLRYPMIFPRVLLCIAMLDGYFFLFEGFIEISLWFNIPMNLWVKVPSGIKWDETGHQECLRGEWVHGAPAGMWFSREYGTGAHFLLLGIPWHPKWLERISQMYQPDANNSYFQCSAVFRCLFLSPTRMTRIQRIFSRHS